MLLSLLIQKSWLAGRAGDAGAARRPGNFPGGPPVCRVAVGDAPARPRGLGAAVAGSQPVTNRESQGPRGGHRYTDATGTGRRCQLPRLPCLVGTAPLPGPRRPDPPTGSRPGQCAVQASSLCSARGACGGGGGQSRRPLGRAAPGAPFLRLNVYIF